MTTIVLTGASGSGWVAGGSAASLLDGIGAASDGKSADFTANANVSGQLSATIQSHAHLPSSVDVTLRHSRSGGATLTGIYLRDANSTVIYSSEPGSSVPASPTDETFALTKVYAGAVNSAADWTLETVYLSNFNPATVVVDQVSGVFDASGEHDAGPGGQLGPNAAILIPTMVSL